MTVIPRLSLPQSINARSNSSDSEVQFGAKRRHGRSRTATEVRAAELRDLSKRLDPLTISSEPDLVRRLQALSEQVAISSQRLAARLDKRTQLVFTDTLTGLRNRRAFDKEAPRLLSHPKRGPLSFLLIDLDHFGKVNKEHGFGVGDQVLKAVGRKLKTLIRSTDKIFLHRQGASNLPVLGRRRKDEAYRLGGEELGIILPNTDAEGLEVVAKRLLRVIPDITRSVRRRLNAKGRRSDQPTFTHPLEGLARQRDVSTSIGGVTIPAEAALILPAKMLEMADLALRHAKGFVEESPPLGKKAATARNRAFQVIGLGSDPNNWTPETVQLRYIDNGPKLFSIPVSIADPPASDTPQLPKKPDADASRADTFAQAT